jgi:hypothetical protein
VSVRSTSLKVVVPVAVSAARLPVAPASSVTDPAAAAAVEVITGTSFVPVSVTVTTCRAVPP